MKMIVALVAAIFMIPALLFAQVNSLTGTIRSVDEHFMTVIDPSNNAVYVNITPNTRYTGGLNSAEDLKKGDVIYIDYDVEQQNKVATTIRKE